MLKRFFTVFLGSVAAIWFSFLVFVGIIFVSVVVWLNSSQKVDVKDGSILYLNLVGEIKDRFTAPSVRDMVMDDVDANLTFDEIVRAVKTAKTDKSIKGIYLRLNGSSMGLAMREELRAVLADFKNSGKWIVAYGDNYDQGDFYTATVAGERYINPSGQLNATGLSATVPFFKNALDKLGVEIQVIKVGTFKSAVEPFILTEMSDSARMMYDVMLGTMWEGYVSTVVDDMKLPEKADSTFRAMAAAPMFRFTADELIKAGFFTGKMYAYEVENMLKKKASTGDKLQLVTPHEYLSAYPMGDFERLMGEKEHIAVLYAIGDIVDSGNEGIVGEKMAPLIAKMADDKNVKGLVLRINSGGGSAFASEQIWASLEYFKTKGKPFIVSMGDVAASGGYYIACGADKIYADAATITGSIGIFGIIPYAKELLNDKLGINIDIVETNPNTVMGRLDAPLTEAQHSALEKNIRDGYDLFIKRVADGRHMEDAAVRRIAEGRVWAGATALKIGLVDETGGLEDAIYYMTKKTGLSSSDCIDYPAVDLTPLQMLMSMDMSANATIQAALQQFGITDQQMRDATDMVRRMNTMNSVQARMEDIRIR